MDTIFWRKKIHQVREIVFLWGVFLQNLAWNIFWEKLVAIVSEKNNKICQQYWGIVKIFDKKNLWFVFRFYYPAPLIFENIYMLKMIFKLHKTGNFNIESMKNYNLLIKWGQINVLRTIYIWLEGIFKLNLTKTKCKIGVGVGGGVRKMVSVQ